MNAAQRHHPSAVPLGHPGFRDQLRPCPRSSWSLLSDQKIEYGSNGIRGRKRDEGLDIQRRKLAERSRNSRAQGPKLVKRRDRRSLAVASRSHRSFLPACPAPACEEGAVTVDKSSWMRMQGPNDRDIECLSLPACGLVYVEVKAAPRKKTQKTRTRRGKWWRASSHMQKGTATQRRPPASRPRRVSRFLFLGNAQPSHIFHQPVSPRTSQQPLAGIQKTQTVLHS